MKRFSILLITAAAKSLQSCPILCDPIDGSPPGSPVPGILQARALEWVAISSSNAWKWKVKVKSLSHVRLFATPWTAAHQTLHAWDFPGKSTGVGCHCLLHCWSLRKCKSKLWDTTSYPLEWLTVENKKHNKQKTENNRCWWGCKEAEKFCGVWKKVKWYSQCRKSREFPQKIKNVIAIWPRNSSSGYVIKKIESKVWKR